MDTAEIRKIAGLCKSEFVNEAYVGSHARGAVGVIRGTEPPIGCAGRGIATGDTVAASVLCSSHRIAKRVFTYFQAEFKRTIGRHRNIDLRASCRVDAFYRSLVVLIQDSDEPLF